VGFSVGFIVFYKWAFKKFLVFFWLGPITPTLKIIKDV